MAQREKKYGLELHKTGIQVKVVDEECFKCLGGSGRRVPE